MRFFLQILNHPYNLEFEILTLNPILRRGGGKESKKRLDNPNNNETFMEASLNMEKYKKFCPGIVQINSKQISIVVRSFIGSNLCELNL